MFINNNYEIFGYISVEGLTNGVAAFRLGNAGVLSPSSKFKINILYSSDVVVSNLHD